MNHEIHAFGSIVRGDVTPRSDVDILVIPLDGYASGQYPAGWSVYTQSTLREYFREGRLFAWHLRLESRCLFSPLKTTWLAALGEPAPYTSARADVAELRELLAESIRQLHGSSDSVVYELGLAYTAIRDIAMASSWVLDGRPNFSRDAPFEIALSCPLDRAAYGVAMAARHASTRGTSMPVEIEAAVDALTSAPLDAWAAELQRQL